MLINTGESGIVYCMECWKYVGLTLTWDVLKYVHFCIKFTINKINFNMGCFEIVLLMQSQNQYPKINFNMGCFEMLGRTRSRSAACLINFNMGCFEISLRSSPESLAV